MTETTQWSNAPAGTYNPFANDARCYAVHYITAPTAEEVDIEVTRLMKADKTIIDFDYYYDSVVDKWVGVTCRDV